MNRLLPWAILAVLAAAMAWFVLPKLLDRTAPAPGTGLVPLPVPGPPPDSGPLVDFRVYRSRDEVVVFARTTEYGLPASDATVLLSDAAGKELSKGRTDGTGVFRGSLPDGSATVTVRWKGAEAWQDLPGPPPPTGPAPLPVLTCRAAYRPGDILQAVCRARTEEERPGPVFRLDGCDGTSEDLPAFTATPAPPEAPAPCWVRRSFLIPHDAPPGTLRALWKGEIILELPVLPRFGAPSEPAAAPGAPDRPTVPGAGAETGLAFVDGRWRLPLPGREEGTAVLFLEVAGDRFLSHAALVPEGEEAHAVLAPSGGAAMRVLAVEAGPAGFREHEASPCTDADGPSLVIRDGRTAPVERDDCGVTATLLAPPGSPPGTPAPLAAMATFIEDLRATPYPPLSGFRTVESASEISPLLLNVGGHPLRVRALATGDALPGTLRAEAEFPPGAARGEPQPLLVRPQDRVAEAETARMREVPFPFDLSDAQVLLLPGTPGEFPGRGRRVADVTVHWSVDAPGASVGSFRLRSGDEILLEAAYGPEPLDSATRTGRLSASRIAGRPLVLESRTPDLRGILLQGQVLPADPGAPREGDGILLERSIPDREKRGAVVEVAVAVQCERPCSPLVVELPLPSCAVPVEDGWEIRRRSPPRARVHMPGGAGSSEANRVTWTLPEVPAGRTLLSLRVRLALRGDFAAPAATARSGDPSGPWARSDSGRIVVE